MIPIVWWGEKERGSWSCVNVLNEMFDLYPCEHSIPVYGELPKANGGVVVFHGGNIPLKEDAAVRMSRAAEKWKFVIFVSVGDENADFAGQLLRHGNMKYWCQTPKPGKVKFDRALIEGYPHDCRPLLDAAGPLPRCFDWFFAGQVNHVRRETMAEALRSYPYGPRAMVETRAFGTGLPHEMYYKMMKQAYVVPCPSGLATPDSFRFAEALEAGCIPVIDACAPDGVMGYWDMVLGPDHPFIVIEDWATFPEVARKILTNGGLKRNQEITQKFWLQYRHNFNQWLAEDIIALKGTI